MRFDEMTTTQKVMHLWEAGCDTLKIAEKLAMPEWQVASIMHREEVEADSHGAEIGMNQTRRDEIRQLTEGCRKATGPSRELDARIAEAVGVEHGPRTIWHIESRSADEFPEVAPYYTSSIDAALSLILEGYSRRAYVHPALGDEPPVAYVEVYKQSAETYSVANVLRRRTLAGPFEGEAPTEPLATVIAALEARLTQSEDAK